VCEDISSTQSGIVCVVDFLKFFLSVPGVKSFCFYSCYYKSYVLLTIKNQVYGAVRYL